MKLGSTSGRSTGATRYVKVAAGSIEPEPAGAAGKPDGHPYPGVPAAFKRIYESADGKMVLFQDSDGHLLAAQASRLA